jgi:hypothetical protein
MSPCTPGTACSWIGTPQDADEVVFAAPDEPEWMPHAEVTEDGRFLVVTIGRAAGFETQLHVLDLRDPAAQLRPLIGDFESVNVVVTSVGTTFYLVTDHGAEHKRLVAVDLESPGRGNWREVIGDGDDTESGWPTLMFQAKEAVRLALDGVVAGTACDGCPPLADLLGRYDKARGQYMVCPVCFNAKKLDKQACCPTPNWRAPSS